MRIVSTCISSLVLMISIASCSQGNELTQEQAISLIREEVGYPLKVTTYIHSIDRDSRLGNWIEGSIEEQRLTRRPGGLFSTFVPSDTSNAVVEECSYNSVSSEFACTFYSHEKDIETVTSLLTESEQSNAIATYEVTFSTTSFGQRLLDLGRIEKDRPSQELKAYFHKFDQGWVVTRADESP